MSGHAAEAVTLPAPWTNVTLQSLAEHAALEAPARVLFHDCPAREGWAGMEPRRLTRDVFLRSARFLAAQLRALGLRSGERVLVLLPNCAEFYLSLLACRLAGAVPAVAPVDESVDHLRGCAERVGAALILTAGRVNELGLSEKARQVAARALCVRAIAGFGFGLLEGIVSLEGWSEEDVDPLPDITCDQTDDALVTFARAPEGPVACIRTEAQLLAEALALHSVLRLDGRRGLISLMHPGACATVAATLLLPLHSGAEVRLIGPYDRDVFAGVVSAAPNAFVFGPDHFIASLDPAAFDSGLLANMAGFLALARIEAPQATILRPGPLKGALAFDFAERGLMTRLAWPIDGKIDLPHRYDHPMESVLPEDMPMFEWSPEGLSGFDVPRILRKNGDNRAERAA